ncbi:Growth arrest and DNA damage-inducible proteins-interacting protein [Ooceraea biroi]|uniref:Large ribosomal subunit protein mL64 n=1 Tax=Ooceraea biroi TaxID=2015173 RepID=A0A026W7V0_OOCBI|nr:Growth arrest and DNA damage-inducible proteins-interacting protein [Ooceraea biroi]
MSLRQVCNAVLCRRLQGTFAKRLFVTESAESRNETVDVTAADEKPEFSETRSRHVQRQIARKQNKSRLEPQHRNIVMGVRPYKSSKDWFHTTVKYKKRMLGRYGLEGNAEPAGFAWPTPEEIEDAKEYERVAYPRENTIIEKLGKMEQWTTELQDKIARKEAALEAARLRKERLVEEVRRHFGFKISPNDNKFKEMLAQKEKEEKKKNKEAKKQAKLERFQRMLQKNVKNESNEQATESPEKSAE